MADQLDAWQPSYTYCWDFLSLWGLFAIFVVLFRAVTDQLSKIKVRFPAKIDQVGGIVFSVVIGWVMVCFTLTTLHTAPLGRKVPLRIVPGGGADVPGNLEPRRAMAEVRAGNVEGRLGPLRRQRERSRKWRASIPDASFR